MRPCSGHTLPCPPAFQSPCRRGPRAAPLSLPESRLPTPRRTGVSHRADPRDAFLLAQSELRASRWLLPRRSSPMSLACANAGAVAPAATRTAPLLPGIATLPPSPAAWSRGTRLPPSLPHGRAAPMPSLPACLRMPLPFALFACSKRTPGLSDGWCHDDHHPCFWPAPTREQWRLLPLARPRTSPACLLPPFPAAWLRGARLPPSLPQGRAAPMLPLPAPAALQLPPVGSLGRSALVRLRV